VDVATRAGALSAFLPEQDQFFLGWDVAGVVDAAGSDVTRFAVGDPVIGLSFWFATLAGTQAEYVVLDAAAAAHRPAGLTPEAASTVPLNALTAAQSLDLLALTEGQTLAVIGAAGAVGAFAVELAAQSGLTVYAVASEGDREFLTGLGAVFVPRGDDVVAALRAFAPEGVDGVLDTAVLGGSVLAAVRDGGAFVTLYGPAAPEPERNVRVEAVVVAADGPRLEKLAEHAVAGRLTLRVAETLPLEDVAKAHARVSAGGVRGRFVLAP
jgi:NADPH:quinone reductase-like Zn-dependent oxidoreductase